ncbi:MAG: hypothetical protein H6598_10180 [Flavobacteriales bacterium]|nr:hypothetical protein [Flavobacteriales bacterium]
MKKLLIIIFVFFSFHFHSQKELNFLSSNSWVILSNHNFDSVTLVAPSSLVENHNRIFKGLEFTQLNVLYKNRLKVEYYDSLKIISNDSSECKYSSTHVGAGQIKFKKSKGLDYIILTTGSLYRTEYDGPWPNWERRMVFRIERKSENQVALIRIKDIKLEYTYYGKKIYFFDLDRLIYKYNSR